MQIQFGGNKRMRLYNVYRLCKKYRTNIDKINITNNDKTYILNDWKNVCKILNVFEKIPVFSNDAIDYINAVPEYVRESENPGFGSNTARELANIKNKIVNKINIIIELYESMNIEDTEIGIDIKLPECETLKDYISYLKEIDFIFSQCPFLQCDNETVKFGSVDVGSNWIKLIIVATSASVILNNTAALVDKTIALRSHYITIQKQEELLKSMQMKNNLANEQIETFNMLKKTYMKKAISELEKECGSLSDGEETGKAEKSIEKLCILLDKGAEIYASLDAPEDVQLLFPEIQGNLELPGELMKYIEDKSISNE